MLILTIRTDKPEAEVGLYDGEQQLAYETWEAHRQLAETLHKKLTELLKQQGKDFADVRGIVVFKGPGSFTGLRIGITVANALTYSLRIPIVAAVNPDWVENGISKLANGQNDTIAMPEYGALPHITPSKN